MNFFSIKSGVMNFSSMSLTDKNNEFVLRLYEYIYKLDDANDTNTFVGVFEGVKYRFKILSNKIENEDKIYFSNFKDHVNSSSVFLSQINNLQFAERNLENEMSKMKNDYDNSLKILRHNISKHVAHIKQEIEYIIPPNDIFASKTTKYEYIKNNLKKNIEETSRAFMSINYRANHIESEIAISELLKGGDLLPNAVKKHEIHKVIVIYSYLFFQELVDKNIVLEIEPSTEYAFFDYNSLAVVFFHLFFNATKYCCPNTIIVIQISKIDQSVKISMKMKSLQICVNEKDKVFNEGERGSYTHVFGIDGQGVGLYAIKNILLKNKGKIELKTYPATAFMFESVPYQDNEFIITLSKARF